MRKKEAYLLTMFTNMICFSSVNYLVKIPPKL